MYKKLVLLLALGMFNGCTGKTGDELYAEGVKSLQEGKSGSAIVLLRSALDKDQNNGEARYQLAGAYVAERKYEMAEREYQKVLRLNPARPGLKLELARLYNLLKKPDQAISHAEEHLVSDPDSSDALEVIGSGYVLKKMPHDAETYFLHALQKNPEKQSARLELAALYLKQGKPQETQTVLESVLKKNPVHAQANYLVADAALAQGRKSAARSIYQKLIASNADDYTALYKAGLLDLETGNTAAADKTASTLVRRFPGHAEGYRLKGFVHYARKEFAPAVTAFQSANKHQPTVAGYYFLGLSLYGTNNLESALSQFRLILDRMPDFHQARLMTGAILLQQRRYDDAISEVSRLVESDQQNALAYNLLGSAYMAKGRYEEGLQAFDRSIKLNAGLIDTYLKKGMIHLSQGNLDNVEANLATAVRLAPEVVQTRIILSSFHLYRNKHAKAFAILNEGLNGQQSDAALYASMARIMFSEKKPAEAIRYLQKSKEKDPGSPDPYFMLAGYHAANGETAKALDEYSALLKLQPANSKALLQMAALLDSQNRQDEALVLYHKAKEAQTPAAYLALARHHEQKGSLKEAQTVLSEGRARFPRSTGILEQQGRLQLKSLKYAEAIKTFSAMEAISPESGIPLLVATHTLMKNLPEAIKSAKRAIANKPDAAFGYLLLASLHADQNDLEPAITELKKAVDKDHRNPQPALALAGLYTKTGNHALALKTSADVLRKHPNYAPAYVTQATILDARGDKKDAVKKYRAALALSGSCLPALNNLAYLCAEGFCSKEEALRLAETAHALAPDTPEIQDTLGYALLKNGRPQEGLQHLKKAEAGLAGNPAINYHLALAHRALGEQQLAVERLQVALRSKDFRQARQARLLLAELD